MTDSELRRLAYIIVEEQARNKQWMENHLQARRAASEHVCRDVQLISAREAAAMLGISYSWFRHIIYDENGNPNFTFIKGASRNSRMKFDKSKLLDEYKRYLLKKDGETVNPFLVPRRNIM